MPSLTEVLLPNDQFNAERMRRRYAPSDLLGFDGEHLIPQTSSIDEMVAYIAAMSGLTQDNNNDG